MRDEWTFELDIPVSRIWAGVAGVIQTLAGLKLLTSAWSLTAAELSCARNVGGYCGNMVDLILASALGAIALGLFAFRNFKAAWTKP